MCAGSEIGKLNALVHAGGTVEVIEKQRLIVRLGNLQEILGNTIDDLTVDGESVDKTFTVIIRP